MFTLTIETGNAAFGDCLDDETAELARILRAAADKLDEGSTYGLLYDANGNRMGSFEVGPNAK